jgi:hypothetical protein
MLAALATVFVAAPIASVVKAEDTTIIKKDDGDTSKTVIKKRDDVKILPVPHTEEKKTIIKKDD